MDLTTQNRRTNAEGGLSVDSSDLVRVGVVNTFTARQNLNPVSGIALNLDGNLDGAAGAGEYHRDEMGLGIVNGTNGTRGDTTTSDIANTDGSFFFASYRNSILSGYKGSAHHFVSFLTVNENGGGGIYGEAHGFYSKVTSSRVGALTGGAEFQNTITAGKPARGSAANLIVKENNAPPTYTGFERTAEGAYTATLFGAGSEWLKGARALDIISSGAQPVGVGINLRGAFARPILFEPNADNGFAVGSSGFVDVRRGGPNDTAFRAFNSTASKQVESFSFRVDGKIFWGPGVGAVDTALERVQSAVLKITNALQFTPIAAAAVPNNTLFVDSADNTFKQKNNLGGVLTL